MSDDADLFAFVQGIMLPHCFSHKSQGTDLRMTIHDIDVDWPLAPAHAAALMATDQLRVLPPAAITSCAHLDNQDEWRRVLARLKLDASHPFHVELAHVALDSVGSASALRAPNGPPRTFATLLYICPSDCVGGAVTVTFDDRTATYDDGLHGEYLVYFNTCTVSVAPIVCGTRGVLVYHVAYHELTREAAMVWAPPPLPSRAQIDQAIANQAEEDYCAMQVVLETPCAAPRFETLDGRDKAIVDWLLRAGCFDMAFMRVGEYHTHVWMDGSETPTYPIPLLDATFHPQCATPALVQEACRWRSMSTYLYDDVTAFHEMDPTLACLVFWPKAHRLTLLGLPRTLRLLRSIVFDRTDHDNLGYGSRRALFAAATRLFISDTPGPRQDERSDEMLLEMARLLYDYGDAALLGQFLSEREWDGQDDMAAVVAMAVDRFGRAAMETPLRNLSAFTSARFRYKVLEHLTQDSDSQHASWLYDIAHGWWAGARNSVAYPYMPPTEGKLVGALQLEAWLHAHAITPDVRALLALRLPLDVITGICAALVNVPPLLQVLSNHPKGVRMLPSALWAVRTIALPPALHRAYVDLAVRCCCDGDANNDAGLAYLLLLTSGSDAFEVVAAVATSRRSSGRFQRTLQANATFSAEQTIALRPFISR